MLTTVLLLGRLIYYKWWQQLKTIEVIGKVVHMWREGGDELGTGNFVRHTLELQKLILSAGFESLFDFLLLFKAYSIKNILNAPRITKSFLPNYLFMTYIIWEMMITDCQFSFLAFRSSTSKTDIFSITNHGETAQVTQNKEGKKSWNIENCFPFHCCRNKDSSKHAEKKNDNHL